MKPIHQPLAKAKTLTAVPSDQFPFGPRHVVVDFLPQNDWTIEVGAPWPAASRSHRHPAAIDPTADCRALGFAPIELVIDKANKKRSRRHWDRHEPLWVGSVIH